MNDLYKLKYLKYKNKLLSLIKQNGGNNIIDEKKKFKKISQIFKTINNVCKKNKMKKSKYLAGINTSLFLHNIIENIDNLDIVSKDYNKINEKINIENKIYFNVNIVNYNVVNDELLQIFYKYLQKRSFKNKTFVMNKKSKMYVINFEELLI